MKTQTWLAAGVACCLMVLPFLGGPAAAQPAERFEPPPEASMHEVMNMAREATMRGQHDTATRIYLWLWDHMLEREPAMYGVRYSFMVAEMRELARRDEAARRAFTARRDQLQERVDAAEPEAGREVLKDWAALNRVIDEEDRILAWWDRVKERSEEPQVARSVEHLNLELRRLLAEDLRWKELALMFPDPEGYLRQQHRFMEHIRGLDEELLDLPAEVRQEVTERHVHRFREDAGTIYAAMLAAGRGEEAARVAELAVSLDEEPVAMRLALLDMAIGAGETRPEHRQWLDEAAEAGAPASRVRQLRRWLDEARKDAPPAGEEGGMVLQ